MDTNFQNACYMCEGTKLHKNKNIKPNVKKKEKRKATLGERVTGCLEDILMIGWW